MPRNSRYTSILIYLALLSAFTPIAAARDRQFDAVVHRVKEHYHKGPIRMMALAAFVANRVHPEGVKKVRIAVFEDLDPALNPPEKDFDAFIRQIAGADFQPLVRVISRRDGEQTFIYARAAEDDFEMLIVSMERTEACVVKTRFSPDAMSRWVERPNEMADKSAAHPDADSTP